MPAQPMRPFASCGLHGHAGSADAAVCVMRSSWPCRLRRCGRLCHAVFMAMPAQPMRPFVSCGLRGHAGSADAAVRVMRSLRPCSISGYFTCAICIWYLVFPFSMALWSPPRQSHQQKSSILGLIFILSFFLFYRPIMAIVTQKKTDFPTQWGVEKHPLLISNACPRTWSLHPRVNSCTHQW
jgi:hypothetical protein